MASLSALSNSSAQINSYANFVNSVKGNGGADTTNAINPEVFYSTQLLDTIRDAAESYQYFKYAQSMPIEGKADKLTVRRWAPLQAHTVPLQEGIPPISDKGSVEKYEMQAYQYGRYMEFTDKVDFKAVDPIVAHYSNEYSIVAVETLDLLARDMLLTCAQKYYANAAKVTKEAGASNLMLGLGVQYAKYREASKTYDDTTIASLRVKPALSDLRLIGLSLKKAKVKPVDTTYHVLVSPEFVFDMLDDPYIQNYMKINQTTENMYSDGALIPMFGFSFHEVVNCPTSSEYYDSTAQKYKALYVLNDADAADEIANGAASNLVTGIVRPTATDGYVKDSRTGMDASYIPGQISYPATASVTIKLDADTQAASHVYELTKVNHILILGKDALARTGLSGEDSAKMYVKPLGSTGVLDPIDQRQSIGFKINSVGFGSTRLEAIVDYICIPTQLNV